MGVQNVEEEIRGLRLDDKEKWEGWNTERKEQGNLHAGQERIGGQRMTRDVMILDTKARNMCVLEEIRISQADKRRMEDEKVKEKEG